MTGRSGSLKRSTIIVVATAVILAAVPALSTGKPGKTVVTERSVREYMQALAGDEMRGRGSATADELAAARYIGAQLKLLRIKPAGDDGGYLQTVKFTRRVRGAPDQAPSEVTTTNVLGILPGRDPALAK